MAAGHRLPTCGDEPRVEVLRTRVTPLAEAAQAPRRQVLRTSTEAPRVFAGQLADSHAVSSAPECFANSLRILGDRRCTLALRDCTNWLQREPGAVKTFRLHAPPE
jgi:hypothetical protein